MADRVDPEVRSSNMKRIRSGDTGPERAVRSLLHRLGFRFRLHPKNLPGRPDIILPKYSKVIFVHGCFWHQHKKCKFAYRPATHKKYWIPKLARNVERDRENVYALRRLGWKSIVIWECELRNVDSLRRKLNNRIAGLGDI